MKDVKKLLEKLLQEIVDCDKAYKQAIIQGKHFDEVKVLYLKSKELKITLRLFEQSFLS